MYTTYGSTPAPSLNNTAAFGNTAHMNNTNNFGASMGPGHTLSGTWNGAGQEANQVLLHAIWYSRAGVADLSR